MFLIGLPHGTNTAGTPTLPIVGTEGTAKTSFSHGTFAAPLTFNLNLLAITPAMR